MIKKLIITILTCLVLTQSALAYEQSLYDYVDDLEFKIKKQWGKVQPSDFRGNYQATFEFWVDRQGKVSDIQLVGISGCYNFDNFAYEVINSSQPFKPLPADFKGNKIKIRFVFDNKLIRK